MTGVVGLGFVPPQQGGVESVQLSLEGNLGVLHIAWVFSLRNLAG